MVLPSAIGTTVATADPLAEAGTQIDGTPAAPERTPIRYPATFDSPAAGRRVTLAALPTTAVAGAAGTRRPVPSARSVEAAPGAPGLVLSTTNGQAGPSAPASVPSWPLTVHA